MQAKHKRTIMKLIPEIQAAHGEIQTLRRTIHAHPELRYEETADVRSGCKKP